MLDLGHGEATRLVVTRPGTADKAYLRDGARLVPAAAAMQSFPAIADIRWGLRDGGLASATLFVLRLCCLLPSPLASVFCQRSPSSAGLALVPALSSTLAVWQALGPRTDVVLVPNFLPYCSSDSSRVRIKVTDATRKTRVHLISRFFVPNGGLDTRRYASEVPRPSCRRSEVFWQDCRYLDTKKVRVCTRTAFFLYKKMVFCDPLAPHHEID